MATTGQSLDPYLSRWLLISAALFLISGIVYALQLRRGTTDVEPARSARPDPTGRRRPCRSSGGSAPG